MFISLFILWGTSVSVLRVFRLTPFVLQCVAVGLKYVAVCCSVLQCVAVCCSVLRGCLGSGCLSFVMSCVLLLLMRLLFLLQCVAACCSVLQCVAVNVSCSS